jgi:chemotaxis protein methyltransferase WspC
MKTARIAALLQKTIGMDQTTIGSGAIRNAIRIRMEKSVMADEDSYLALLMASQAEMTALIEEIVVPETWFFRHEEAFRLLESHLVNEWRSAHPGQVPRLLSIPCSSGEEAYSMVMTLLDAGFSRQEFHVDAIDISNKILNKARLAVFSKGSFRNNNIYFRQRYFRKTGSGYALQSPVRHGVHFHQANVLDHIQMQKFGTYDVIFCRNLLIYFNQNDRKKTVELLSKMLKKDGLLFVGHAETGIMWKELFNSVPHPMAFAYRHLNTSRKVTRTARLARPVPTPRRKTREPISLAMKRTTPKLPIRPLPPTSSTVNSANGASETVNKKETRLAEASRLADQGKLEEARQLCETCLQENGSSVEIWFLLGLINDIQGLKEQAEDAFRKVLYLNPDHDEALIHLALLLDQLGRHKAAQHLRDRIQHLNNRQKTQAARS